MPKILTCRRLVAGLTLLLGSAACGDNTTAPETYRARWSTNHATNYTYVSAHSCECVAEFANPLQVIVNNNAVTAIRVEATGQPVPLTFRPTIDGLFDFVENERRTRPNLLEVSYHATLGYPIRVKYGTPENDGGGVITVTSLTIAR